MERRIKRILLLNPPRILFRGKERKRAAFPLGLGYISSMLKLQNYEVIGIDTLAEAYDTEIDLDEGRFRFGMTDEQIKDRIKDIAPDVVGVTNLFTDGFHLAVHLLELAKSIDPSIVTLMGGVHPTSIPEVCLANNSVDFVILGEGELTVGTLFRAIDRRNDLHRIPGIAFRDKDGVVCINPLIEPITPLDILPFPDRRLFPLTIHSTISSPHGDEIARLPYAPILTSRGCPARCIYCAGFKVHGRQFRARSPENVVRELDYLIGDLGFREIHFEDDNFTHIKPRALEILQMMKDRQYDITWTTPNGISVYNLDDNLLKLMKDTGCYAVWIAIESGDPQVLRKIKKPMPLKRIERIVQMIKDNGIKVKGFFMYGFPGETAEQMERTFQLAKKLKLDYASFFLATPLPGTEMWNLASRLNPPLQEDGFNFDNLKYAKSNLTVGGLDLKEMERLRKKVWLDVNWNLAEDQEPPPGK